MHIKKYDHNYSRRHFLDTVSKGAMGAGVLAPLWPLISNAQDITKAYPDELLSIEGYTKGKVSTGDMITADNVEYVKDSAGSNCLYRSQRYGPSDQNCEVHH
jgi:hypothetical protein